MAAKSKTEQKIVFGAMTIGRKGANQVRISSVDEVTSMLDLLRSHGHDEIDTARTYGEGSSEELLGSLDLAGRGFTVGTKISPKNGYTHKPTDIRKALLESLDALQTSKIDLWYLHAPDHSTPYEETLREVNKLYEEGRFCRLGISNYSAWETAQICEITICNGWKRPDVYQGGYNAIYRVVEPELFPCLRYYGIAFYSYNPLAGGMLTDRYQRETQNLENGSRFDPSRAQGNDYRNRYWKDVVFDAMDKIRPLTQNMDISTTEAALRWLSHHSQLDRAYGDAVLVGASSASQLQQNLLALERQPLPQELVEAFDEAWELTKSTAALYFR